LPLYSFFLKALAHVNTKTIIFPIIIESALGPCPAFIIHACPLFIFT
jgi:hypothetical protein